MRGLPELVAAVLIPLVLTLDRDGPVVETIYGRVQGNVLKSFLGDNYAAFKGIPYARPPLGDLRFRAPQAPEPWGGILDATQHRSICLQYDFSKEADATVGSEDCLFLNVYTPLLPQHGYKRSPLPVMVVIHNYVFNRGSGDSTDFHAPDYLMDKDVVVVTFNFRLDVFGFFTTSDAAAPGNYGLLDQALVLRWVRDNIAAFGGDPTRVALTGQSGGAASVGMHVLSPQSHGLFSAAISQSGSSMCKFAASGRNQVPGMLEHALLLGCPLEPSWELVACFRSQSAEKLMATQAQILSRNPVRRRVSVLYQPRVDGEDAPYPFLPEDPYKALSLGHFNRVPWINGLVRNQAALVTNSFSNNPAGRATYLGRDFQRWAELLLDIAEVTDYPAAVAETIYNYYCRKPGSCYGESALVRQLSKMLSDRVKVACTRTEVELASVHTPVYTYVMDYDGPGRISFVRLRLGNRTRFDLGVTDAEDLFYLFRPSLSPPVDPDSDTYRMIQFMTSLWVNFATTGVPSFSGREVDFPDWPTYSLDDPCGPQVMRLNLNPSVGRDPFRERVQFWKQLDIKEAWNGRKKGMYTSKR